MESVCIELQNRPHLLQLWDELAIFLGLFGSTRSERASYDREIMCELYNPTGIVRRQLVSRTNIMVKPRLCILAAGHPRETINCLIAYAFMKETIYGYECESVGFGNDDDYLASNLTKAVEHVQKLALILHILKIISRKLFGLITQIQIFGSLDGTFKNLILADSLKDEELIIDYESCFNAKKMMDYFLSIKKILAGYDPINNKILTTSNVVDLDGIPQSDVDHIKSYITNHPSQRILLSVLPSNLKRKYTKDQYLPILRQLETDGHGTLTTTDNTRGPKAIVFIKKKRIEQTSDSQAPTTSNQL